MMKALVQVPAALLCTLLMAGAIASPLQIGASAPDFALPSLQGHNLRLSEYRSDVVVLNFMASWCNRCADAMPALNSIYGTYRTAGLQVLAVGVDFSSPKAAAFANGLQPTFPLLVDDAENSVSKTYELENLPLTLVIDREGRIRFVHTSFDKDTGQQLAAQVAELLTE